MLLFCFRFSLVLLLFNKILFSIVFQAKIPCSANCKCIGCRNVEETLLTKKSLKDLADAAEVQTAQLTLNKAKMQQYLDSTAFRPAATSNTGARLEF